MTALQRALTCGWSAVTLPWLMDVHAFLRGWIRRAVLDYPPKRLPFAHRPVLVYQAVGAELDLADKGLGVRSRRYAMMTDDGMVRSIPAHKLAWRPGTE